MVKQYLDDAEVEYETINMSEQPEYQEKYDVMGAPTILLLDEDEVIAKTTGFDPETLDTLVSQLD
jgi:thioredoxin 1